jgi:hypothetical protein
MVFLFEGLLFSKTSAKVQIKILYVLFLFLMHGILAITGKILFVKPLRFRKYYLLFFGRKMF